MTNLRLTIAALTACATFVVAAQTAAGLERGKLKERLQKRQKVDADANGVVEADELADTYRHRESDRQAFFNSLDANGDGHISSDEWPDANSFKNADVNGNGSISLREFEAKHLGKTLRHLEETDRDDSRSITTDEYLKRAHERGEKRRKRRKDHR